MVSFVILEPKILLVDRLELITALKNYKTDFEEERKNLKNAIEYFLNCNSLIAENKLAGKFTKDDWGKLNYNHIDHHLRQFGV